jgi:hypothetical protein
MVLRGNVNVVAAALHSATSRNMSSLENRPRLSFTACGFANSYSKNVILGLKVSKREAVYPDQNPVMPFSRIISW